MPDSPSLSRQSVREDGGYVGKCSGCHEFYWNSWGAGTYCGACLHRHAERLKANWDDTAVRYERLVEVLEWIAHQTGVSTCDDAVRVMNEVYEAALKAVNPEAECDRCGKAADTTYAPEYGAHFCDSCAANPQAVPNG